MVASLRVSVEKASSLHHARQRKNALTLKGLGLIPMCAAPAGAPPWLQTLSFSTAPGQEELGCLGIHLPVGQLETHRRKVAQDF